MKKLLKTVVPTVFLLSTHLAYADSGEFKRWAVSAGWLHVMPQGKANTTHINTAVEEGGAYKVGDIQASDLTKYGTNFQEKYDAINPGFIKAVVDGSIKNGTLGKAYSGSANVNGNY